MPRIKDEKTSGKCAFKIIEYMGAGIPAIASHVGENKIVISNGIDGYLCENTNDWVDKIKNLKKLNFSKKKIIKKIKKIIKLYEV